jgi:hypothetical protein
MSLRRGGLYSNNQLFSTRMPLLWSGKAEQQNNYMNAFCITVRRGGAKFL